MKYYIVLYELDIPKDWTHFHRTLKVVVENAPANFRAEIISQDYNESEHVVPIDVEEGYDVSITVDQHNDEPPARQRFTAKGPKSIVDPYFLVTDTEPPTKNETVDEVPWNPLNPI